MSKKFVFHFNSSDTVVRADAVGFENCVLKMMTQLAQNNGEIQFFRLMH